MQFFIYKSVTYVNIIYLFVVINYLNFLFFQKNVIKTIPMSKNSIELSKSTPSTEKIVSQLKFILYIFKHVY